MSNVNRNFSLREEKELISNGKVLKTPKNKSRSAEDLYQNTQCKTVEMEF